MREARQAWALAVCVVALVGAASVAQADEGEAGAQEARALWEAARVCEALMERREAKAWAEAARCYTVLAYQHAGSPYAAAALFNAAVSYEQAGEFGIARVLHEELVRRYPQAEQAAQAAHRGVILAQSAGDWDAALQLTAAAQRGVWAGGYAEARDALASAVMMRYAQGDWALLERDVEAWERLFGRMHPEQAAQMAQARVEASRLRDAATALEAHEAWLKRYGRKAPRGLVLRVEADRLELLEASKQDKRVEREAPRLLQRALALEDKRSAAVAQLALARQRHRGLDTGGLARVSGPEAIKTFLDRYLRDLREAEEAYMRVVELREPEHVPSAVLGVASIYVEFAQALAGAPTPRFADKAQHDAYRAVVEEKAASVLARGCKTATYGARSLLNGGVWSPDARGLVELAQRCEGAPVHASEVDVSAVRVEVARPSFAAPKARVAPGTTVQALRRASPGDHGRWYALAHRAWGEGALKTAAEAGAASIGPHPEAARLAAKVPASEARSMLERVARLPDPGHVERARLAAAAAYALGRCDEVARLSAPLAQGRPALLAYALGCLAQRPTSQGWELVSQLLDALERAGDDPDAAQAVAQVVVETTQALAARPRDARALPHALHMSVRARQLAARLPATARARVERPLRGLEAWLQLMAHQPQAALAALPSASADAPAWEQTLRVAALVALGDFERARPAADALTRAAPDDPTARYLAALAQLTPALSAPLGFGAPKPLGDAERAQLDAVCAQVRRAAALPTIPEPVKASAARWTTRACAP